MSARIPLLGRAIIALVFVLTGTGVLTASAVPAAADVDDFTFDSFHADMLLTRGEDGHALLAVTETIVARFPDVEQNRGIVRAIPDDDQGVALHTQIVSVTSGAGDDLPYAQSENDGFVEIATGDDSFVTGVQTYVISYTQRDTVRAFADTGADELYRDLNGTGWAQPFGEVSAYIVIDPPLADSLTGRTACYVGAEGSTKQCTIVERDPAPGAPREFFPQAYDLAPGENVSVAIGFAPGTFVPGEVERNAAEKFAIAAAPAFQTGSIIAAMAAVGAAIGAFFARRPGRDAPGRGVIVAEYDPPREVSVVQAAHLVSRPTTAIPAAIVDLAVNGHARIVAHDDSASISFEYAASSPGDPARQRVLDDVFGLSPEPGRRIRLGADASSSVRAGLTGLSASAIGELRAAGLTQAQSHVWPGALLGATALAFAFSIVCVAFAAIGGAPLWLPFAALIVSFLAGIAAATMWRSRDRVTDAGAAVRDRLRGLRDYLQLAEADRIRMLQSPEGAERRSTGGAGQESPDVVVHLYERLLPYAIVWGIEKEWAQVLETRLADAGAVPHWYLGTHPFTTTQLVTAVAASRAAATPVEQSWSSSGGSSFSGGSMGGGFSGGGAGGGGGGGR